MADYPSVLQHVSTVIKPMERAVEAHRAHNGTIIFYDLSAGATNQFEIDLFHQARPLADRDAIISHWTSNQSPTQGFNWVYDGDGQTYSCIYFKGMRPGYVWNVGGHWNITVKLYGVF